MMTMTTMTMVITTTNFIALIIDNRVTQESTTRMGAPLKLSDRILTGSTESESRKVADRWPAGMELTATHLS